MAPTIDTVVKGFSFPRASGDPGSGVEVIRIRKLVEFQENVLRIIQRLNESIEESEAAEKLAKAQAAVMDFKFDPGIIILRHRAGIEKDATIIKSWRPKYNASYNQWRAIVEEGTNVTMRAGGRFQRHC